MTREEFREAFNGVSEDYLLNKLHKFYALRMCEEKNPARAELRENMIVWMKELYNEFHVPYSRSILTGD